MVRLFRLTNITLAAAIAIYAAISKYIFDQIYLTSDVIVDEEFHLPLGQAYCQYQFDKWDPKVTTLPGLYLLTALLMGQFQLCSTYWLRFVSLLTSVVNVALYYMLLKLHNKEVSWKNILSALNLSILPPLYFFSHVYYTDVASITMTLLLLISARKGLHYLASVFGVLSILMRQTNVIWIGMLFGDFLLKQGYMLLPQKKKYNSQINISLKELKQFVSVCVANPLKFLKRAGMDIFLDSGAYLTVIFSFGLFVYLNGSIVVGDKTAHEATIHIPQLFYFSLFTLIFAWPHFITNIPNFCMFVLKNKILLTFFIITCLAIVHFNTLVHPYLLADNRHYTFYIWTRFYQQYHLFRYAMIFVYIFAVHSIVAKIWNTNDVSFPIVYLLCLIPVLVMQKLIDIRYYLFPFILFRMQVKKTHSYVLFLESLTYLLINGLTLYLFFTKKITWDDYEQPQRLMW